VLRCRSSVRVRGHLVKLRCSLVRIIGHVYPLILPLQR
jgi:hypothetical protein